MAEQPFAEWLREAMESRGLKQVDLLRIAAEQGVKLGKSQLSQYLSGKTIPRPKMLAFFEATLATEIEPTTKPKPTKSQEVPAMRKFSKSSKLDNVSYDVRGPALDEAMRMEEEGIDILKLNIGNPAPFGFRTPDEVVQDMASLLRSTPISRSPLDKNPMPGHLFELPPVNEVNTKGQ